MRSLLVAVALAVTVAPAAHAKKHLPQSHVKKPAHATRRAPTRVPAAVETVAPTRVAASRAEPATTTTTTAAPVAAGPVAAAPPARAAAAPVAHGPAVDQAGDDEVPGSRTKKR